MLSYYPGCTVRAQKEDNFEREALGILSHLGVPVKELSEWECCGAMYPLTADEYVPLLSSVRALKRTQEEGNGGLLTFCSACYHVLKRVNNRMLSDKEAKGRVEGYLDFEYDGKTKVYHLLEVLRDLVGFGKLKEAVVNPLSGKKVASYYGCLFLRPEEEMALLNAENPQLMDEMVKVLGGEPVNFPYKTDCCGAFHIFQQEELVNSTASRIIVSAKRAGAEEIITACPLCKHNLEVCQGNLAPEEMLPVNYVTNPIVRALGGFNELAKAVNN